MQTVSSASNTCLSVVSAVEWTATVLMPSSRHARKMRSAISPRLAIRTLSTIDVVRLGSDLLFGSLFDDEQRLTVLDRAAVLDEYADHSPGHLRLDLVHHLHRLDPAQRVAGLDLGADVDERLRAGRGAAIEGADHRRGDLVPARGRRGGRLRALAARRRGGRWRGRGGCRGRGGRVGERLLGADRARVRVAADPDRLFALGDLDFRDSGFLEQLDEFFYFSYVHYLPPRAK